MMGPTPEGRDGSGGSELVLPGFGWIESERLLAADELFVVVKDRFPVTTGHCLIIARRPVRRFRDLSAGERVRLLEWVDWVQQHLERSSVSVPEGFNLGINDGPAAGQTIPQLHFHVIPRRAGDVPNPGGGIRWVIPDKAAYWELPGSEGGSPS